MLLNTGESQTENNQVRICAADELIPVAKVELPRNVFSLTDDLVTVMHTFLEKCNAFLEPSKRAPTGSIGRVVLINAQIRSRLLMVLGRLFRDPASITCCLESAGRHGLIPLLIKDVALLEDAYTAESLILSSEERECESLRTSIKGKDAVALAAMILDIEESLDELESRPKTSSIVAPPSEVSSALRSSLPQEGQPEATPSEIKRKGKKDRNRRKKDERKGRTPTRTGKSKLDMEDNSSSEKHIRAALAGQVVGDHQPKMAWNEDCGYALVFLGLDRRTIQYFGSNGDCLVLFFFFDWHHTSVDD